LAIRRSLRQTGTEISREKFSRLGKISTECENGDTSVTARKGRQMGGEDKVKVTGKVKGKVVRLSFPNRSLFLLFPSCMRGFRRTRGKNVALILCSRRFRRGQAKSAYSSQAATAAT
jgi:hypothetical protein